MEQCCRLQVISNRAMVGTVLTSLTKLVVSAVVVAHGGKARPLDAMCISVGSGQAQEQDRSVISVFAPPDIPQQGPHLSPDVRVRVAPA